MGYVYFIGPEAMLCRSADDELSVVKIGYTSSDPKVRLAQLQTGSPVQLNIFAHIVGSVELERAFHRAFEQMGRCGEWFMCEFKLRDFLSLVDREGKTDTLVQRDELICALRETIFCFGDKYAGDEGIGHRELTAPEHLAIHFPEVWK